MPDKLHATRTGIAFEASTVERDDGSFEVTVYLGATTVWVERFARLHRVGDGIEITREVQPPTFQEAVSLAVARFAAALADTIARFPRD